jgi:hypothetical protein
MATFLLVHGGGHRGWHWGRLRPVLEGLGHATVAPDVPMDEPGAGAADWAQAAVDALAERDEPGEVILVAHSLAGLAAPIIATRATVRHMVFLCANVPALGMSYQAYLAENPTAVIMPPVVLDDAGRLELEWPDARALYYGDCEESLAREAWEHLVPSAALTAFTEVCPLDVWPDVPATYILCQEDRIIGPDWSRMVSVERLGAPALELPGSHSPMLSRPEALGALLHDLANHA